MKSLLGENMIFTKHVFPTDTKKWPYLKIFKRSHLFQTVILGINLVFKFKAFFLALVNEKRVGSILSQLARYTT